MSKTPISWGKYHTLVSDHKIHVATKPLGCSICYRVCNQPPPLDSIGVDEPYKKIQLEGSNVFPMLMNAHLDCTDALIEGSI